MRLTIALAVYSLTLSVFSASFTSPKKISSILAISFISEEAIREKPKPWENCLKLIVSA